MFRYIDKIALSLLIISLPPQNPKNQIFYIPENTMTSVNVSNYPKQNLAFNRNQNQRYVLDPISQSPLLRNHSDLKRPQYPEGIILESKLRLKKLL